MRSKADETLVIVETLICPLQISDQNTLCYPWFVTKFFFPSGHWAQRGMLIERDLKIQVKL